LKRSVSKDLAELVPAGRVLADPSEHRDYLTDGTGNRGVTGNADLIVIPTTVDEVAAVVGWCYTNDLPIISRGGGTGLAGGAVPDGGVVLSLEELDRIRSIRPERWQMEVEAGVKTATIHRKALENGLFFPPDPGASEQSTIGGNIATNAGGPHAFKYGVTGHWVTGLEVVLPPGRILRTGGPFSKDVSGLDLTDLLIGSEGTLGIVTAAWLRLVPAPEERGIAVAFYDDVGTGCEAVESTIATGVQPTALEFLDRRAVQACIGSFPLEAPYDPGFAVIAEADGSSGEVGRVVADMEEALGPGAIGGVLTTTERGPVEALWSWRDGVSIAVAAQKGGKISEDIVVPLDRLAEAIEETVAIGERHGLTACSWGHAGDGNLHSTFLVDLDDSGEMVRGRQASDELFEMAIRLGGSISGEHGIGSLKTAHVADALGEVAVDLERSIKSVFDPKGLLNPGKKIPTSE
jgi:glycolate oxidase subunit GlcD